MCLFSHEQDVIGKEPERKGTVYHAVDRFYTDYMLNAQCVGYSLLTDYMLNAQCVGYSLPAS